MNPERLEELVGQEPAIRLFKRVLSTGRFAHSYLLTGPEGTGKRTCALLVTRILFCGSDPPCLSCRNCRKLLKMTHPDLYYVDPSVPTIKIGHIREVEGFLKFRPLEAPYKVVILPEAERMTPEAANALLKSLEEPPTYAVFFLTSTSSELLLPTIVSRSQEVRFRPIPTSSIKRVLTERFGKEEREAEALSLLSRGSLGKALELSEKGLLEDLHRLANAYRSKDPATKLSTCESLARRREELPELLTLFILWLWYSYLAKKTLVKYPEVFPEPFPEEDPLSKIEEVEKVREGLEAYGNPELALLTLVV